MTASPATPPCGIWAFPAAPAPQLVEAIVHAERVGLDEVWLGDEGPAREPFGVLAAAAVRTERIRLAVGITNPYVRNPALACTSAQTIGELSGGRCTLGLGAGGDLSLGPLHQERTQRPMAAIRSMIGIARAVERGEAIDGFTPGQHAISGQGVPIFVGAKGERLNRLASELADGAFVAGPPPFAYDELLGWVRSVRPIDVALVPSVAWDVDDIEATRAQMIVGIRNAPADVRRRLGVDDAEVDRAAVALAEGDAEPARRLVTDEVAAELVLLGEPEVVGRRLAELVERHRPASIGLALLHGELTESIDRAAAAFDAMRSALDARR
ncbi:MAG: LLM class flavin-dependent oxidoreductase [Actinomycetota bacterium]